MQIASMQYKDLLHAVQKGKSIYVKAYLEKIKEYVFMLSQQGVSRLASTKDSHLASSQESSLADDNKPTLHYAAGWRDGKLVMHQSQLLDDLPCLDYLIILFFGECRTTQWSTD